jgi:uroporphyrinogen-III synthase
MRRVLVLRPEPGASATVERARSRGLDAVALPLFEVEQVEWDAPEPNRFDAILLTSANAVRHGGDGLKELRGLPVHAVGAATADAARQAGFELASWGEVGVERLLDAIDPQLKLLHLAGADRKVPTGPRQEITSVVVYRAKAKAGVDVSTAKGCVALIHSTRAAERFAELIDQAGVDRGSIAIAAISREAAEALGGGWSAIDAVESPDDDALLALTERLCNNAAAT